MYIVSIIQLHCLIHKSQSRVQGGWRIPPRIERELYDDGNDRGAGWKIVEHLKQQENEK